MKTVSVKEKIVIIILCIWSFLHTYFLINNVTGYWIKTEIGTKVLIDGNYFNPVDKFYPFTYNERPAMWDYDIRVYDYTEYFVYVGGVWMMYLLYRYFKGK